MGILPVTAMVGRMVALFGLFMLVPLGFSIVQHDKAQSAFTWACAITWASGIAMSLLTRRFRRELQPRDGFLLVSITWLLLPAFGALPLMLGIPGLSFTDAYFEAMSGLTTTGATVLTGLEKLPVSINVWRCLMVLLGGMGIIVLVVAVLPLLGVGASQLYKGETAGPMKDQKLTPRMAETARGLWGVYFLVSTACFFAYHAAGMSWTDAFIHMCSTMGLGGFAAYDASFAAFNSPLIEAVAVFFMLLAGVNFALYFLVLNRRSLKPLLQDLEARVYLPVMLGSVLLVACVLAVNGTYPEFLTALRHAAFTVVSIATTTGFVTEDYEKWPPFVPALLLFLSCFATCAGSTGGGMKMIRALLMLKLAGRELTRIAHPRAVFTVTLGGGMVSSQVLYSVLAFMLIYGAVLVGTSMLLVFSGLDLVSSFSAAIACINNMGPGLGKVGPSTNFQVLTDFQTWVCTFAMMLGRLELLSVLVLFTPQFWRR